MKTAVLIALLSAFPAFSEAPDELPHITVQEWGVITWSGDDPVVSSTPETPFSLQIGPFPTDPDGYAVRAPVLYFNGPEFTGTVTVQTDNGAIFDIYPPVENENRTHSSVTWSCGFSNQRIEKFPDPHGTAPGEWNYELWRVDPALTITGEDGWQDKFLYYETAPETVGFLPYTRDMESICEEYRSVEALVIKNNPEGIFSAECTLEDLVYGGVMEYAEINHDEVLNLLFSWSVNLLEPEQMDALWNTWSSWILVDHAIEGACENGMILYLLPAELAVRISTIEVQPDEVDYPVDIYRYLLVALPL